MELNIKNCSIALALSLLLFACNGNKDNVFEEDETTDLKVDSQTVSAENVFNAFPSRERIIELTGISRSEYNPTVLNDPITVNKYATESSKALNLGVYGADLNVTGIYEQTDESFTFLQSVNILAKSLGIGSSFDERMIDRMTANKSNRDSTLEIVSQAFKSADTYLKANGRPGTSSLIVAGAWIEGVYLACCTAKETGNEAIVKEVFTQAESLNKLISLIEQSNIADDSAYVLKGLSSIKKIFDAKSDEIYTMAALTTLDKATSELRTKVTSGK